ncbi:tetratricopeptide repeat protein [Flavobacterium sp. 5]|uniref:tetratricopeptide repeat protein n=1 Tax=Flavobacterium sp. 5 TaxID=2035199 RepID=UPI000C2C234F|nr:tetratricopeptide repeat protein [Flavobacterium sp. 5]PKB17541.1 tetratricopeptide repeat protein [Flavobacterium sp. 5]
MKKNYIIVLILLLFTGTIEAQKDKIKEAEKEMSSGNLQGAITILKSIEYQIYNSNNEERAQYYFIKGNALLGLADKKIGEGENLVLAVRSYKETIKIESESGKRRYSGQIQSSYKSIKERLEKIADNDSKEKKFIDSANERYEAYLLDQKDTINLYNAASAFVNGKDFTTALKHYETLKAINYSGIGTNYFAINRTTKTENNFATNYDRELSIQAGTHEKPRTEKRQSKRGEIYKNMALLYAQNGDREKAKKVISDARIKNPEDISLVLTEADLFLESKDYESYKKTIAPILKTNPNDVNVIYNLGVLSAKAKNITEAENFYLKAVTIDPKYINAYINLSVLKLEEVATINEDMDKLGTSPVEMKKYDILKVKRDDMYKSTIPYLQKANEMNPQDEEISKSLLSVYNALEMTAEYKELKAKSY